MEVRMQSSVLTLGEKIVLAARLASIEHVRQELDALALSEASKRDVKPVGDRFVGVTDDPELVAFTRPVPDLLKEVFARIEAHAPNRAAKIASPKRPVVRQRGAA
jgi:hypothetical protein